MRVRILSISRQEMCLGILIELWVDGKILRVSCVKMTLYNITEV